jgi:uncharacterized Zn finger protein (UPF0148 family)
MRQLTVKYQGECSKCGAALEIGTLAMYEKTTGIFCPGCEPKTVDEIRAFRTEKAERKAGRYQEWADKREKRAEVALNSHPEYRHDWAFITQPGHIPARARMNAADDRAFESLDIAKGMREKAENILNVRVAGDAERKRQANREESDKVFSVGSRVFDYSGGNGEIVKVCKKSYKVKFDRGFTWLVDKSWIRPAKEQATA